MTTCKLALGAIAFSALASGAAHAAGTAAGTNVQNTFTLDYSVDGTPQPQIDTGPGGTDDPTEFTVDRLIDLTVASNGDETVAPGATDEELVFSLTNNGNDTQAYVLSLFDESEAGAADDHFDTVASSLNITYYIESGDAVGFDAQDIAGGGTSYTPGSGDPTIDLPPDAILWIVVDGDIPTVAADPSLDDGDTADITLVADTVEPSTAGATAGDPVVADTGGNTIDGAPENVLADGESLDDGTYDREQPNQGDHAATATYIVASADLAADKSVAIISQDGTGCGTISFPLSAPPTDQLAIPGACVEYRITVQNTGSSAASNATDMTITDALPMTDATGTNPAGLEFVGASIDGFSAGSLTTEPAANTDCDAVQCTVELTGGAVDFGETAVIVIHALIK